VHSSAATSSSSCSSLKRRPSSAARASEWTIPDDWLVVNALATPVLDPDQELEPVG
jgi:hypothetical protein